MQYYQVDVFAEKKYQGNQLAVFFAEPTLPTETMQQITRETKFSEATFVVSNKQANGGYDVRIFTQDTEVPFAGHPTLGTAFVLSEISGNQEQIILNLGVGQIPVTFANDDKTELWMQQNAPEFGPVIAPEVIAEILHLEISDINTNFPLQVVSTGLPAIIVPLQSLAAVKKCFVDHQKYQHLINTTVKANLLVFSAETIEAENDLNVRVFVDDPGFFEDPATGSANGNLAGYLVRHNFFDKKSVNLRVEQGYEIGRRSLLKIKTSQPAEQINIQVGGKVFLVAKGEWMEYSRNTFQTGASHVYHP